MASSRSSSRRGFASVGPFGRLRSLLDEFDIKALVLYDPDEEPVFAVALLTALIPLVEAGGENGVFDTDGEATDDTGFVRVEQALDTGQLWDAVHCETAENLDWGALTRG